jgi:hypothetical protein
MTIIIFAMQFRRSKQVMNRDNATVITTYKLGGVPDFAHDAIARGARDALHVRFFNTDLTRNIVVPEFAHHDVVRPAINGPDVGASEVLADDLRRRAHAGLSTQPAVFLQTFKRQTS